MIPFMHSKKLKYVTKQWSSHEGTVEYNPSRVDQVQIRSHSQSVQRISTSTTAILQLDQSCVPMQYDCRNVDTSVFNTDLRRTSNVDMNYYRDSSRIPVDRTTSFVDGGNFVRTYQNTEEPTQYTYQNEHRFFSAYNQRLAASSTHHSPRSSNFATSEMSLYSSQQRSSSHFVAGEVKLGLTVTEFVNQRYRPQRSPETSPVPKQRSCDSPNTEIYYGDDLKRYNTQTEYVHRQKSCEISTYIDYPSTYRPLQEPSKLESRRNSHISSSRKSSFHNAYGNTEVTIGIEQLSLESSTSPELENVLENASGQDYLSVNRYFNNSKGSLCKQKSCESPPCNEEFAYAQKYKLKNCKQRSCDSPTYTENEYCETQAHVYHPTPSYPLHVPSVNSSQTNLSIHQSPVQSRRTSCATPRRSFRQLSRQPSVDIRDAGNAETHNPEHSSPRSRKRESISDHDSKHQYLSPVRYESTGPERPYSRSPITKQKSCEINTGIDREDFLKPKISSSYPHRASSSSNFEQPTSYSYDYEKRSTSSRRVSEIKSALIFDPVVSSSSTDLRHMRKTTAASLFSNSISNSVNSQTDMTVKSNSSQYQTTFSFSQTQHLDVPKIGARLTKQRSYDPPKSSALVSSNSSSPAKHKGTSSSPSREQDVSELSQNQRKFSHDSNSHRKSIKSDKSIWSQAIMSLKKKREIFFGKRSKTRSIEKNLVDPVYHFLKCTANIDHNPAICECPCHSLQHTEFLFHAHSSVNLPAITRKTKHK